MIVKAALLVIVVVLVLTVMRRWNRSRLPRKPPAGSIEPARKCPECGVYLLGARPEPCARPDCPVRGAA